MSLKDIINNIKLPFRKEKELYYSLKEILGFCPGDITYYKQALLHKSIGRRNEKGRPVNNERLEFLGDAILDAIVGDIVYRHFDGKREGFLTNTRSKIVQRDTLNKLAQEMGITDLILTSGKSNSHNSYMGGNAFEALVGAIYLDRGYDACMKFMNKRILNQLINIDKVAYKEVNFKSKLIEWTQKNKVEIEFKNLEETKDKSGSPVFKTLVIIENLKGGKGEGFSKKESQQNAAKETLAKIRKEPQFTELIFAEKSKRTKMEENPTTVPDIDIEDGTTGKDKGFRTNKQGKAANKKEGAKDNSNNTSSDSLDLNGKDFDLSDIHIPGKMTKEDIIAAAEEQAFQ